MLVKRKFKAITILILQYNWSFSSARLSESKIFFMMESLVFFYHIKHDTDLLSEQEQIREHRFWVSLTMESVKISTNWTLTYPIIGIKRLTPAADTNLSHVFNNGNFGIKTKTKTLQMPYRRKIQTKQKSCHYIRGAETALKRGS